MPEVKYLNVGEETTTTVDGGQSTSSAQVGTEPKALVESQSVSGVYGGASSGELSVETKTLGSQEKHAGTYVKASTQVQKQPKKNIVNTILVDETKQLIDEFSKNVVYANYYTKAQVDYIVDTVKKNAFMAVDTTTYDTLNKFLDSTGEQGYVYLYPVDTSDLTKGYKQYIWEGEGESATWIYLGDTNLDLTPYFRDDADVIPATDATYNLGKSNVRWGTVNATLITNDYSALQIKAQGQVSINLTGSNRALRPTNNNDVDLGTSSNKWKNLYLSGIIDALNVFNVIDASDIASNYQLTADQVTLLENGKPTLILGTYRGYENLLLMSLETSGTVRRGYFVSKNCFGMHFLNTSNNELGVYSSTQKFGYMGSIYSFNGKAVPDYPSSTGTFVLKCVDGTLTWVQE